MNVKLERSYPTPVSNSTLLPLLLLSLSTQKYMPRTANRIQEEYDYIVVGGGSAGSVVASRLSEKSCVSVLLLEAGPEPPLLSEVPAFADYFGGTGVDWQYKTVPQRHGASVLNNQQIVWPSGKMLGGSGSMNGMAYIRGNHKNFDDWAAQGAEGWSFQDVLPYFLKMEDFKIPAHLFNGYHAVGGPITVEDMPYDLPYKRAIFEAANELGHEFVDTNGERQTGFFDIPMNLRNRQRCSSVKSYLVPADEKKNLDILLNAHVTKVLIEDSQAKGVEFFHEGQFKTVKAKREVILSAGAVNTPQILMLSGIGPKDELEKLNIPTIADLPVGKNFHDHCATQQFFTLEPKMLSFDEKLSNPSYILQYILSRSGPLVTPGHMYGSYLDGSKVASEKDFPSLSIFFFEVIRRLVSGRNLKPEVYKQMFGPYENETLYQCSLIGLQPKSRGTITLNSSDPFDPPLIDPNYLEDERDLQVLVDGIKVCRNLLKSAPLQRLGAKPIEAPIPGCEHYTQSEDDYLRCYVRAFVYTYHHGAGTAKMGDPGDPTIVVDPQLRVKNINGLRVADASIMPIVVSGNPNVPIMMIGEKASDMIKNSIIC